jgi:hypothetical protein
MNATRIQGAADRGQISRLQAFREMRPGVSVREGLGFWQATIPEANGMTVITRYMLADLLDELDAQPELGRVQP